jgi:AcrR family transcriptional regulator
MATTERKTAEERRAEILVAACYEFADGGLTGTSTEDIARRAGISQPYLFRLFGTKKDLFIASVDRCMADMLELFREAADGLRGEEALHAIGEAYGRWIVEEPRLLRHQMQAYAACSDEEVCVAVQRGFGELVDFVERHAGVEPERVSSFFSKGMLLNVIASMNLLGSEQPWARRLIEGCREAE